MKRDGKTDIEKIADYITLKVGEVLGLKDKAIEKCVSYETGPSTLPSANKLQHGVLTDKSIKISIDAEQLGRLNIEDVVKELLGVQNKLSEKNVDGYAHFQVILDSTKQGRDKNQIVLELDSKKAPIFLKEIEVFDGANLKKSVQLFSKEIKI